MLAVTVSCVATLFVLFVHVNALLPANMVKQRGKLMDPKEAEQQLRQFLNTSEGAPLAAMMEKVKKMSPDEINALVNASLSSNSTLLREGKQYGGGFYGGGGFGYGGIGPILLALLLRHDDYPRYPVQQQNQGNDLAALATLSLLGLALISRFPTQG